MDVFLIGEEGCAKIDESGELQQCSVVIMRIRGKLVLSEIVTSYKLALHPKNNCAA